MDKYTEDNLPVRFQFETGSGMLYTAKVDGIGFSLERELVVVSWIDGLGYIQSTCYTVSSVVDRFNYGNWWITNVIQD